MRRQCPLSVTMCFINMNMQFMSRSSSSTHSIHYNIVAFVVSILLTLVQIRYPSEDLFRTHYKTMVVVMASLLAYCFVFGVISYIDHAYGPYGHRYGLKHNWCCMAMMGFGLVPIVSLLSLLFPDSAWRPVLYLLWVVQLLLVIGLLRKLVLLVMKFLPPLHVRRTPPLLPLTLMDLSRPVVNSGSGYCNDWWFFCNVNIQNYIGFVVHTTHS